MKYFSTAAFIALFAAFTSPAFAKTDCDAGFKSHMGKMTIYIDKMSGYELADAVRMSVDAYRSCQAGDSFSPHGVWDKILAEMETKSKAGK